MGPKVCSLHSPLVGFVFSINSYNCSRFKMKNYINVILWAEGGGGKDGSLLVNKFFNLMDEVSESINDYFMENNNTMKQSNILNEIRSDPIIIGGCEKDDTCRYCSELITLHDEKGEKVVDRGHIIHE